MSYMTAGKLQAFEALMKEVPGFDHYDSGCDGICPECRSCRFHRPHWKYQSCVFDESPKATRTSMRWKTPPSGALRRFTGSMRRIPARETGISSATGIR